MPEPNYYEQGKAFRRMLETILEDLKDLTQRSHPSEKILYTALGRVQGACHVGFMLNYMTNTELEQTISSARKSVEERLSCSLQEAKTEEQQSGRRE